VFHSPGGFSAASRAAMSADLTPYTAPVVLSGVSVASIWTSYPLLMAEFGSLLAGKPTSMPELSSPGTVQSSFSE
jgi:hypothetical protein